LFDERIRLADSTSAVRRWLHCYVSTAGPIWKQTTG
jgi:hypothetical protein